MLRLLVLLGANICRKLPRLNLGLEHFVDLGDGAVLGLWNTKEREDKSNNAEAAEDEATQTAEVALVAVEHVRYHEIEQPRRERGVNEGHSLRQCAQTSRRDFSRDDGRGAAAAETKEKSDELHHDTDVHQRRGIGGPDASDANAEPQQANADDAPEQDGSTAKARHSPPRDDGRGQCKRDADLGDFQRLDEIHAGHLEEVRAVCKQRNAEKLLQPESGGDYNSTACVGATETLRDGGLADSVFGVALVVEGLFDGGEAGGPVHARGVEAVVHGARAVFAVETNKPERTLRDDEGEKEEGTAPSPLRGNYDLVRNWGEYQDAGVDRADGNDLAGDLRRRSVLCSRNWERTYHGEGEDG